MTPILAPVEEDLAAPVLSKDPALLVLLADLGWKQVVDVKFPHLPCAIDVAGQTMASYSGAWGQWFLQGDQVTPFESFHAAILTAHQKADARKFFEKLGDDPTLEKMLHDLEWRQLKNESNPRLSSAVDRRGVPVIDYNGACDEWFVRGNITNRFKSFENAVRYEYQQHLDRLNGKYKRGPGLYFDDIEEPRKSLDHLLVVDSLEKLNATLRQFVATPAPVVGDGMTEERMRTILEADEARLMERVHALLAAEAGRPPVRIDSSLPEPSEAGVWWNLEGVQAVGSVRVATLNKKVAAGVMVMVMVETPGQPVDTSIQFVPGGDVKGGKIVCGKP